MLRFKTFNATGVAPDGRLYAGDLNQFQDLVAALSDFTQTHDVGTLRVGDSSIQLLKFGAAEGRITAALRVDGILRGLGGVIPPTMTTAARDALTEAQRPYGMLIVNTTTNRLEQNVGTAPVPVWIGVGAVEDNTISTAKIQDNAITQAKMADNSVGAAELIADSVGTSELAPDAVTADEIAANAVGTAEIADNSITQAKMADNSVGAAELIADSVGNSELADDAVQQANMANDSVGAAEIIAGAVGTGELADSSVTSGKIAPQTINAQGGNYTLTVADRFKLVQMTSAGASTVTIPANATQAFAIGDSVDIIQWGAGQVTLSPAGGVTLVGNPGLKTIGQYTMVTVIKVATDIWVAAGALTP